MNKRNLNLIIFPIIVVLLLGTIYAVIFSKWKVKTPATYEQVWDVLEDNGYTPIDSTEHFRENWKEQNASKGVLNKAVTVQEDDIRFDYYIFDSDSTADYYRGLYVSYTRSNRYDVKNVEFSERLANYTIYTIKAAGMYTAVVMVDNTLVFAYSDSENSSVIYDMIVDIGYFDKD